MSRAVLETRLRANSKLKEFYDLARSIEPVDKGHDFSHIERVMWQAYAIMSSELSAKENRAITVDETDAVFLCALLHDCVPVPKNSPLRKESSRLASEKAREWLLEKKWNPEWVEPIALAILDHSYSSGRVPSSLLGEALQDADRLEALGALGLYRTIATGISMGTELFDTQDPWAERRELDDKRFSIDHFFTKLLKLPDGFRTNAAKIEAKKRADFLIRFVEQLKSEIN